jgi:hypothetical protein
MAAFTNAKTQHDAALAAYRAIPSRSRKAKHAAAQQLHTARETLKAITRQIEVQILTGCGAQVEWTFRGTDAFTLSGSLEAVQTAAAFCEEHNLGKLTEAVFYDDDTQEAYGYLAA